MIARNLQTFALGNGLTVIAAEVPDTAAFSLSMHIQAGSRDEDDDLNGAFHFLEHMMFRGSDRYKDSIALAHALESLGGANNATTDAEVTTFWIEGHARRLEEGFDIFSEFFFHPKFHDMEIERSILLQELAEDCNEEGHIIDTSSLAMAALFDGHPLGRPVIGTSKTIERITRKDLERLKRTYYRPDRSVLVVASPFPADQALRLAEQHFAAGWKRPSDPAPGRASAPALLTPGRGKPRVRVVTQNNSDSQFDFRLMLPAHGGTGEAVVVQKFLERLLDDGIASRLVSSIREKRGMTYDIACEMDTYADVGTCSVAAALSAESFPAFLQALGEELRRLVQELPAAREMERIRSRYLFSTKALPEDLPAYLEHRVWQCFVGGPMTLEREIEIVEQLTPQRVLEVAQDVLGAGSRVGVLVGPDCRRQAGALERFLDSLSG